MEIYEKCLFSFALLFICRRENLHMKGGGILKGSTSISTFCPPATINFILSNVMLSFGVIVRSNRAGGKSISTFARPEPKKKRAIVSPKLSIKSSFAGYVRV